MVKVALFKIARSFRKSNETSNVVLRCSFIYTGLFEIIVGVLTTTRLATSFSKCNPMWFLSMGLRQGSGLCSSSSRKYPGTEGKNQNRH